MNIQHIHGVPPLYTNTFLIITNAKHGIIIDAAAEPGVYLKALDEVGATLTHILLTHGHYDHVGAVAALKKATGCKVYMDPVDAQGSQQLEVSTIHHFLVACKRYHAATYLYIVSTQLGELLSQDWLQTHKGLGNEFKFLFHY